MMMIAIAYVLFLGNYISGVFAFAGMTLERFLFRAFYTGEGLFGFIANISASYVFMFMLFAAFLMIISFAMPGMEPPIRPLFKGLWLTIHVGTIFIGNGLFAIAFLAGIMYLIQEYQIKQKKLGSFYNRLPSLATMDDINYHSLVYGFPFMSVGMITGSVYAQYALGTYWQWDPKEVWSLITWLFYAALLHERLAVGWRGRKAAIMSIICFLFLICTKNHVMIWCYRYLLSICCSDTQ